jgi:inosine-uridine nucleoside N-ribohydrolase
MTRTKILIDCDPGHDDAVAILFAARHLDLVGITTVHGNSTVENTTRNALAILELAGIDVPVAIGCADPLAQRRAARPGTGLDGTTLPEPGRRPLDTHAIEFLIETAHRHRGELVLAAIGPQTNVAMALRREPRLKDWLREITIMGGSTGIGNATPAAEFNMHCDPEAAWAVFHSGAALRMVGLNVTRSTGLDPADLAHLKSSGRQVAGMVADVMGGYLARVRGWRGVDIAPLHDVCAIVPHVEDGLIDYLFTRVDIELAGTHTRGMTVCDLRQGRSAVPGDGRAANAMVAVDAKRRPLVERVLATLLSWP